GLKFFLVENPIFEPGTHENVKTRFRSHGLHCFRHGTEWGDSNPSCRQHDIGLRIKHKSVAQGAEEIQWFPHLTGGEPFGSFPYDPVKELEAKDSILFCEAMHAEGTPQNRIHPVRAPNVVKLAGDRRAMIPGEIETQPITVLSNHLIF
ncbi:MAG TPA: hypothetical protein VEP29_07950, partial [Desulfatiglandales bacterium]|nr:hypothetical protein [Desulfatiglandales bacterium]